MGGPLAHPQTGEPQMKDAKDLGDRRRRICVLGRHPDRSRAAARDVDGSRSGTCSIKRRCFQEFGESPELTKYIKAGNKISELLKWTEESAAKSPSAAALRRNGFAQARRVSRKRWSGRSGIDRRAKSSGSSAKAAAARCGLTPMPGPAGLLPDPEADLRRRHHGHDDPEGFYDLYAHLPLISMTLPDGSVISLTRSKFAADITLLTKTLPHCSPPTTGKCCQLTALILCPEAYKTTSGWCRYSNGSTRSKNSTRAATSRRTRSTRSSASATSCAARPTPTKPLPRSA